ncbi:SH3 domain-containing protein, partial [Phocea massiliensis]
MYRYEIIENSSRSYDLHLYFDKTDAEFAREFLSPGKHDSKQRRNFFLSIQEKAAGLPIKSVKIFVAGVLVATMSMQAISAAAAQADGFTPRFLNEQQQFSSLQTRFHMTYLYGGTVSQQIEQIKQVGSFQTVSPSYFDLNTSGSLVTVNIDRSFIDAMHAMGIKVVPMLSNHWNRTAGEKALSDPEALAQSVADAIVKNNLDGVNVDIENVTHLHRNAYTEFVRLLRQKLPAEKEVSVAVAANPNGWTTGWHGSYDYAALAKYADYLMIMAYDESWEGSSAGPVASYSFVKRSIEYALEHTTADKLVVGVPFYGRMWSSDGTFSGNGLNLTMVETLVKQYNGTITYDTSARSPKAQFTVNAGDPLLSVSGKKLTPGSYTVWFEDETSIYEKTRLIHQYDLKGMGSWSLTQATDGIRSKLTEWLTQSNLHPTPQSPLLGTVTASSLRVRKEATTDSETIAYYQKGDSVTVIGTSGSFYQIKMANGQIGYVSAAYVTISENQPAPAEKTGYSTGDRVRIRALASTSSSILTHVNRGDSFTVHGESQNGWYAVTLKDGTKGYISADYVLFTAPSTPATKTGYSTGDRVRIRSLASTSSSILTHVN